MNLEDKLEEIHQDYINLFQNDPFSMFEYCKDTVQEIYDEFEKRTCKNCKFDWCGCDIQDSIFRIAEQEGLDTPDFNDFGCNRFKRKKHDIEK